MNTLFKGGLALLVSLSFFVASNPAEAATCSNSTVTCTQDNDCPGDQTCVTFAKAELSCASKLAKAASKLTATIAKSNGKCRSSDISGKAIGSCPDAKGTASIAKATAKLIATAEKSCSSTCTGSEFPCIGNHSCPASAGNNVNNEFCSGGGTKVFDATKLGFPGAYCDGLVDGTLDSPTEIGECAAAIATVVGDALVDGSYGDIVQADGLDKDEAKCVATAHKAVLKYVTSAHKAIMKCRDGLRSGKLTGTIARKCATDDADTAASIAKVDAKFVKTMGKCLDGNMAAVDFCGNGPGATANVADAIACLRDYSVALVDQPLVLPINRPTGVATLMDATDPPDPFCGDNLVNQLPNAFVLSGEECDGTDDSACAGLCLPPGDNFQCTCSNIKRSRFLADGLAADLDNGWTGAAHSGTVSDRSGFVLNVAGCDCTELDGMDCIGSTSDPICERVGKQQPTCSWEPFGGVSCDDRGNQDGNSTNRDCQVCGAFAVNAGESCGDSRDCGLQCVDAGDAVVGTCDNGQSECPAGSVCRGACDPTATCLQIPLGAPLPLVSAGNATCLRSEFREDITGTVNMLTGENATFMRYRTIISGAAGGNTSTPCPVCGGLCVGGGRAGDPCRGSCSVSGDECRFDTDCDDLGGETCTSASAQCGTGTCDLELICSGGEREGLPCRFESTTLSFGTPSNDCPPDAGAAFSQLGALVNFLPSTSEPVVLPSSFPCSDDGFKLFDCPCEQIDGDTATKPNNCTRACNAVGPQFGNSCSDLARCSAGSADPGYACDEQSDCPGGTCDNLVPAECAGGLCVPLCAPDPGDAEEGICAAGPFRQRCDGFGHGWRTCSTSGQGCAATCSVSAGPCITDDDCPGVETCSGTCDIAKECSAGLDGIVGNNDDTDGAGICETLSLGCFLNPIQAEGGDRLNGQGDPNNVKSVTVLCVGSSDSDIIDAAAGLPGPVRLRQTGINATNGFTSLP